ncbi:MAG: DUF1802 family protein [Planctomycetia bacterium]|jgi:hypothetical protein
MQTAFKEWAAICRALAQRRQDVILRKGGIVEPGGGFRLEHREFLLLPTFLHQSPESLIPAARDLLDDIDADRPPPGQVVFTHAASVTQAHQIRAREELTRFRSRHVWSDAVVTERFHRWRDELHVLEVDVTPLPEPLVLPWHDDYGGCKSWVTLRS